MVSPPPQANTAAPTNKPGFYVGGNLYRDWASVPQSYKDIDPPGATRAAHRARSSGLRGEAALSPRNRRRDEGAATIAVVGVSETGPSKT